MSTASTRASPENSDDETLHDQVANDAANSDTESCKGGVSSVSSRVLCWADEDETEEQRTTVMLRNLPNEYSRDMLTKMLENEGFGGRFDFIYLPIDFRFKSGFGYAFINMVNSQAAEALMEHFQGFTKWSIQSEKVAEVTWSNPSQGLDAHVERYRNSPVMHEAVPDEFKPAMFANGERIDFPTPTKAIRMPRLRHGGKK